MEEKIFEYGYIEKITTIEKIGDEIISFDEYEEEEFV